MENFENTWSTTITELLRTFEAELIKDLGKIYSVTSAGKPGKQDKQFKTLAFLVSEQNLYPQDQFMGFNNASDTNNYSISASLAKKHLRLTLDRLYIKVKDMLQPLSQGNNFEDLEPQQSWSQSEQSAPIISSESQAMVIDSKLSADAASFTPKLANDPIITWDVSVITPSVITLPAAKSKKGKEKQGSI
ncbi:hypothetical protein RclHR1_12250003 [Rhizophagus clarus]|uniref:Uncharacterized protein n=1 Tax=Rhizophagus clarus TaxID=94130 RepID=A0A2Z6Q6P5_9GLOM|nr:hypothetical protein RclHR1_12250003 [Rhizophagus clarus]GES73568.1 hypothetical protein RCL_e27931_RclHR1_12250003 [Rhizophagus clarus]